MDSTYPKTLFSISFYDKLFESKIFKLSSAPTKFSGVAQGCHLGNQAEFVLRSLISINQQKNSLEWTFLGSQVVYWTNNIEWSFEVDYLTLLVDPILHLYSTQLLYIIYPTLLHQSSWKL